MNKTTTAILAVTVCAMQTATPQSHQEAQPYSIELHGTFQPSNPDNIEYPYPAAARGLSGQCDIALHLDQREQITALSILGCSDPAFRRSANTFILQQDTPGTATDTVRAVPLKIVWKIGDGLNEATASIS